MTTQHTHTAQQGSTLFLTLIMLVVLTIISLATLGTSLMELRMSNNAEAGMAAAEASLSILDMTIDNSSNFNLGASYGSTNCTTGTTCTSNTVSLPAPFNTGATVIITSLSSNIECPYRSMSKSQSCSVSKSALFDVYTKLDRSASGQGKVEMNYGFIQSYPSSPSSPTFSGPGNSSGN